MGKITQSLANLPPQIERNRQWWGLSTLLLAGITVLWGFAIPVLAIPALRSDFGSGIGMAELVLLIYPLVMAALIQPASRWGEQIGQRSALMVGLGIMVCGSLLAGFTPSLTLLFLGRILQAIGAAIIYPQLLALLHHLFSERERPRAFSTLGWGLVLSMGIGPLIGGAVINLNLAGSSWRPGVLLIVPLAALALLGVALLLPQTPASKVERIDYRGPSLLLLALLVTTLPLLLGPEAGWPLWLLLPLIVSPLLFLLFGWSQRELALTGGRPLLHPTLCLERGFVVGALLLLLLAGSGVAFFLFTLITLQLGAGWGAGAAAATYFPTSLAAIAGALLASRLIPRWGQRVVSLGCALSALGELLALLTINLAGFQLLWWQLLPALIVVGLGQGLAFAPLIGEVLSGLRPQFLAGAANSLANLGLIGKVVGVAGISVLFLTSQSASGGFLPLASSPEHYLKAYQTGLALIAGLTLIATTLTFARPALPSPNALLEPRRSSGLTYTVYLLSGGNIPARIFNDLIRLPTVESKTEVESAPLPLGEFLAYHFESSNEDANWYRYLAEEAQTLGAGPIPQESERRAVVYQKVEEIRQRQMDGLIPSEFDPAAWRLMTFALATCPHLLPQMTRLTTGHAPDTPEFRGLWGKFLRRLGERIAPSV